MPQTASSVERRLKLELYELAVLYFCDKSELLSLIIEDRPLDSVSEVAVELKPLPVCQRRVEVIHVGSTLKCFVIVTELSTILVYIIDSADCWGSIFSDHKYLLEYLLFGLSD